MKINGFGKDFGMTRTNETLRKDQDKQTKEKNSTTKPQEKADTYSISPEAKAKMEEVAKQQQKVGEKPEEPQQGKGKITNHVSELRSASEDGLVLTEEQISACSSGVEQTELLTTIENDYDTSAKGYDTSDVTGPKQDIVGNFSGEYKNNSWETTFPSHNPPELGWGENDFDNFMEYNLATREEITNSINQLLAESGIVIPEGVEFDISVDPYDYQIHVTGVDGQTLDPELEKQIELALNKGDNGKNLYDHLDYVNKQFSLVTPSYVSGSTNVEDSYLKSDVNAWTNEYQESTLKLKLMDFMEEFTGYGFDELEHRDGAWYTPDGENAWTKASSAYISTFPSEDKKYAQQALSYLSPIYQQMAEGGFDAVEDRNLTVTYSGGSLYDYGTAQGIGDGQTGWVDELRTEYNKNSEGWIETFEYLTEVSANRDTEKAESTSDDGGTNAVNAYFEARAGKSFSEFPDISGLDADILEELLAQLNGEYENFQTLLDTLLGNND